MARLRFGYFIAPFHRAETNPTLALQRDLNSPSISTRWGSTRCGWANNIGGRRVIGSPEMFLAAAAERAKRIRFGTGVVSLAYHNPFRVADRFVLLDHLSHGRISVGWGRARCP